MLGFARIHNLSPVSPIPKPIPTNSRTIPLFPTKPLSKTLQNPRFRTNFAKNGDELKQQSQPKNGSNGGNGEDELRRDLQPLFNLKWKDLLYPDTDNLIAVGLTGLLTWASVQVLWQLLVISIAILFAALKYSFVAALLLFILITLL
ncbi:hypothetical protein Syun_016452 [Stephania yunnanensis]|uniref:Uncharacterized protein n=1 Tax=Stephania yunnanensis TaxID=152371 RepID=A0AAP0J608_9MAGN